MRFGRNVGVMLKDKTKMLFDHGNLLRVEAIRAAAKFKETL
jgi:hypothetical protein